MDIEPGAQIIFIWDVSTYVTLGSSEHQLKVQVEDELGLAGVNAEPLLVKVTVQAPPKPSEPTGPCDAQQGSALFLCQATLFVKANWIALASLLIALVAVIYALTHRGQIAHASGRAVSAVRHTIANLRGVRGSNDEAGWLEVLRGDSGLQGERVSLYRGSTSVLGRNPQEVDVVFDAGNLIVSRRHCEFEERKGVLRLRDLGSTHGTFVNGDRIPSGSAGVIVKDDDRIELGPAARGGVLLRARLKRAGGDAGGNDRESYSLEPSRPETPARPASTRRAQADHPAAEPDADDTLDEVTLPRSPRGSQ
jgi:hypothetical protein